MTTTTWPTSWQEREADEREALDELGPQLAERLGEGWTAERPEGHWGITLTSPGSQGHTARLFVSFDRSAPDARRRERVIIHGTFPHEARNRYRYGEESDHQRRQVRFWEISVAVKRGAATIAKEIQRRLLPGYLADLDAVAGWQAEHERSQNASNELAEKLAATLGHASVYDRDRESTPKVNWNPPDAGYGRFRVSESRVYAEQLSLSPEQALRVAEVLAE